MSSKVTKKKKINPVKFILLFILFVVVLFSLTFNDVMSIIENKEAVDKLKIAYQDLLDEEASLKSEVNKLQDSDYVARYAREKYMYTKDGEVILKIID